MKMFVSLLEFIVISLFLIAACTDQGFKIESKGETVFRFKIGGK